MPVDLKELGLVITQEQKKAPLDLVTPYDMVIIGGGPSGMTAGVYASRKKLRTLLISNDLGGQVLLTSDIENYLGYQYITGQELSRKFEEQIKAFPIDMLVPEEVSGIAVSQNSLFKVVTKSGKEIKSKTIIIASGKRYRTLGIPGEKELTGKGVAYCATCDAPLFAGKEVVVVGGGNSALSAVIDLLKVSPKIVMVNNRNSLQADPVLVDKAKSEKVTYFLEYGVKEIKGKNAVEEVVIENLKTKEPTVLKVQGVFIEVGLEPNSEFARNIVAVNKFGEILVDCAARTSVEGVFAAGDVTNVPEKQIIVAAGEGAKASLAAYRYLLSRGD